MRHSNRSSYLNTVGEQAFISHVRTEQTPSEASAERRGWDLKTSDVASSFRSSKFICQVVKYPHSFWIIPAGWNANKAEPAECILKISTSVCQKQVALGLGINHWEHESIWLVVEAFLPRSRTYWWVWRHTLGSTVFSKAIVQPVFPFLYRLFLITLRWPPVTPNILICTNEIAFQFEARCWLVKVSMTPWTRLQIHNPK
jgi:hypothetical protein